MGIQPKMLDPDPYQIDTDPKHWYFIMADTAQNVHRMNSFK